jgi:hypothetical protein
MHSRTITEFIVNGKVTSSKKLRQIVTAMGDADIIAVKGGYIFNVSFQDTAMVLGVMPYLIHGQRTRHYDIKMPEDRYMLVGFINSNGTLDLMFKVSRAEYKAGLSNETKQHYADRCIAFAAIMHEYGLPDDCVINQVTVTIMAEIGLTLTAPNLQALATCQN